MGILAALSSLALVLAAPAALAASMTFSLTMTGAQEVPGPGDADGLATGTLTLDDVTGLVSWNFAYSSIAAPTAMHIHGPGGGPGSMAGVLIGLGVATSGGAGTLIDSTTHGTLSDISAILTDPVDYYVNIHNGPFGGGAVRGQVPEPGTAALLSFGLTALAAIRRL